MNKDLGVTLPVRARYDWSKAKYGYCDYCQEWAALVDGCCPNCYDSEYQQACEQAYIFRIKELIAVVRDALEQLSVCQRHHYICEDSYYSCPASGDSFSDSSECDCGADVHNARINAIISSFEEALNRDQ